MERKLDSGFIVDVAIHAADRIAAAIEIRVSHAIDENKSALLEIPFMELNGQEVVSSPNHWSPIKSTFKTPNCKVCETAVEDYSKELSRLSNALNLDIPEDPFYTGITSCWKCKKEILVFDWLDSIEIEHLAQKPRTLEYRYTKDSGSHYWANTCPSCSVTQGDFYLHHRSDSPFFGIHYEESEKSFADIMLKIALKYLDDRQQEAEYISNQQPALDGTEIGKDEPKKESIGEIGEQFGRELRNRNKF